MGIKPFVIGHKTQMFVIIQKNKERRASRWRAGPPGQCVRPHGTCGSGRSSRMWLWTVAPRTVWLLSVSKTEIPFGWLLCFFSEWWSHPCCWGLSGDSRCDLLPQRDGEACTSVESSAPKLKETVEKQRKSNLWCVTFPGMDACSWERGEEYDEGSYRAA